MKKYSTFEIILRFRAPGGGVESEATIRDDQVEIVNYWPNGRISGHGVIPLALYIEEARRVMAERSA